MKTKGLLILLIFISSSIYAQRKVADRFFNKYSYIKAGELYEEAVKNGDTSKYVLERLGDCYYNNSNSEKAAFWYKQVIEKFPDEVDNEYLLKYVQTQQSLGNYNESDKWLESLNESDRKNSKKVKDLISTEQKFIEVKNLDVNSEYSDFGIYLYNKKALFASTRKITDENGKKIYGWNEQPYLDLYEATISDENEFSDINLINGSKINTKYHESSAVVTNDGKTLYFTRVNVNKRNRLDYDKKGTTYLKLYKATLENGSWENIQELPFNGDTYSTGHPALSPDNKKLYFVSDRDGGYGKTDIYYVDILDDGNYSTPKNLGENINSKGREMFPFIAKDNTLYFSSDDYINIGLLDIFKSNFLNDGASKPENLGAPYNSGDDDFAFVLDSDTDKGFFSSNRIGGKGSDDIYSFTAYECSQSITGIARDSKTNEVLSNTIVKLIDSSGKIINETITSVTGEFIFEEVDCGKIFTVLGNKPDYKDDIKEVNTSRSKNTDSSVDLFLIPLVNDCEIVINPIFFDFDKWEIRTNSKVELESIVDVMREHPEMILKIESHTDSRGTEKYNLKLSNKRAQSTKDYLVSRGINTKRFESAIGYGESQPVNDCDDKNSKCSEEQHEENRRSHFYIIGCEDDK